MSGISTHGGNMTVNIKNLGTVAGDGTVTTASRIDILIWHDSLLEIQDGSCQVSF